MVSVAARKAERKTESVAKSAALSDIASSFAEPLWIADEFKKSPLSDSGSSKSND
jgi:hypothetical protein